MKGAVALARCTCLFRANGGRGCAIEHAQAVSPLVTRGLDPRATKCPDLTTVLPAAPGSTMPPTDRREAGRAGEAVPARSFACESAKRLNLWPCFEFVWFSRANPTRMGSTEGADAASPTAPTRAQPDSVLDHDRDRSRAGARGSRRPPTNLAQHRNFLNTALSPLCGRQGFPASLWSRPQSI